MADVTATHREHSLVTFDAAALRPTAEGSAARVEGHPALADDIRTHAAPLLDGFQDRHLRPQPSDDLLTRTRATTPDTLDAAGARATRSESTPERERLAASADTDVTRRGRAPLAALVRGRLVPTAPDALPTRAAPDGGTRASTPRIGSAKAEVGPLAPCRPFADLVWIHPTMPQASEDLRLSTMEG